MRFERRLDDVAAATAEDDTELELRATDALEFGILLMNGLRR